MELVIGDAALKKLQTALQSSKYTAGTTHNFYHYPARFSPEIARAVIEEFSEPEDWVLDPFMGGGTSIIEGLMTGRRMVGVDSNALAHFVTKVRTTPLPASDESTLIPWIHKLSRLLGSPNTQGIERQGIRNLPASVETFIAGALALLEDLPRPRQRAFARCALLRLGQWALDCRDFVAPRRRRLARELPILVRQMLAGSREFAAECRKTSVLKNSITGRRILLHRSAVGIHSEERLRHLLGRFKLVLTSPPYPGVHILYHRWQYRGRKETPAPYWITDSPDGFGESFYTGGSRTPTGLRNYFQMIEEAFRSIRALLSPNALVVQLVGFGNAPAQLPLFLQSMEKAGFAECRPVLHSRERLDRRVPNRKWYAKLKGNTHASREVVLIHRLT